MTNFIVIKLMEKANMMQKMKLVTSFEEFYAELSYDQFGFIVLSKVIENIEISVIFNLCYKLINDSRVYERAHTNPNSSLLIQNVFDCEYLSYLET